MVGTDAIHPARGYGGAVLGYGAVERLGEARERSASFDEASRIHLLKLVGDRLDTRTRDVAGQACAEPMTGPTRLARSRRSRYVAGGLRAACEAEEHGPDKQGDTMRNSCKILFSRTRTRHARFSSGTASLPSLNYGLARRGVAESGFSRHLARRGAISVPTRLWSCSQWPRREPAAGTGGGICRSPLHALSRIVMCVELTVDRERQRIGCGSLGGGPGNADDERGCDAGPRTMVVASGAADRFTSLSSSTSGSAHSLGSAACARNEAAENGFSRLPPRDAERSRKSAARSN